ncbi:hypothetical protein M758_7G038300 [Ceratodon purpureus]|nr:hypothetical protein M758_7G038300 [Ceratodon purpureus]
MQPGRPFLRSLQTTFLMHIKGKVHAEDGSLSSRLRRKSQRCTRPERVDSDPRAGPLERSDIVHRVLAAVKACSGVDAAKVTEHANFEDDLQLEKGDVVVLVLGMLKKYGLSLTYVEARRMTTCAEVIDYIESQICQEYSSDNEDH